MTTARSLHIKCTTWDQVQSFTDRKLRRGNLLSMKVPFAPGVGDPITLGLELPSEVVVAIDGAITKTSDIEGTSKTWVEVELTGLTMEIITRLRAMVIDGRNAPKTRRAVAAPNGDELAADERGLFVQLSAELKRLRSLPVHGVLGISVDAEAVEVRRGWLAMVHRFHPDGLWQPKVRSRLPTWLKKSSSTSIARTIDSVATWWLLAAPPPLARRCWRRAVGWLDLKTLSALNVVARRRPPFVFAAAPWTRSLMSAAIESPLFPMA